MSDDNLKVTPVALFAADFILSSWKSDNLAVTLWYSVILHYCHVKFKKCIYNTLTTLFQKPGIVFLTSSKMNNIFVRPVHSRFSVKLICCITLRSVPSAFFCLDLLQSSCSFLWSMDNPTSTRLYRHLQHQWQTFECCYMF